MTPVPDTVDFAMIRCFSSFRLCSTFHQPTEEESIVHLNSFATATCSLINPSDRQTHAEKAENFLRRCQRTSKSDSGQQTAHPGRTTRIAAELGPVK